MQLKKVSLFIPKQFRESEAAVRFRGHNQAIRFFYAFYLFYFAKSEVGGVGNWDKEPIASELFDFEATSGDVARLHKGLKRVNRMEGDLQFDKGNGLPSIEDKVILTIRVYSSQSKTPLSQARFYFKAYTGGLGGALVFPEFE